jgi:hypothetical protein
MCVTERAWDRNWCLACYSPLIASWNCPVTLAQPRTWCDLLLSVAASQGVKAHHSAARSPASGCGIFDKLWSSAKYYSQYCRLARINTSSARAHTHTHTHTHARTHPHPQTYQIPRMACQSLLSHSVYPLLAALWHLVGCGLGYLPTHLKVPKLYKLEQGTRNHVYSDWRCYWGCSSTSGKHKVTPLKSGCLQVQLQS